MRAMDGVEIIAKLAEEKCDSSNLFIGKTESKLPSSQVAARWLLFSGYLAST